MPPKVSVVIPVYNVGKQLEKCLDSVVAQTFPDIEIIVVNDGSTDNSPEIIARYADKDSRIVVIDKSNEGLAYARKSGDDFRRVVGTAVVDDDDFYVGECLSDDRVETFFKVFPDVINRYDDRDGRHSSVRL